MVRIFFLPYLGKRSKSDPCSYELFCLESHILSFPKILQIPPESPCILEKHIGMTNIKKKKLRLGRICCLFWEASGGRGAKKIQISSVCPVGRQFDMAYVDIKE